MLNFFNSQLKLNCEVGISESYLISESDFMKPENLKEILPNCHLVKDITVDKIINDSGTYCLSFSQFRYLLKEWEKYTPFKKVTNLNWFNSYLSSILYYGNRFGEHTRDSLFNPICCYEMIKNEIKNHITAENPMEWNNKSNLIPEISWAVSDCLHYMLNGGYSKYETLVNSYIENNIRRMKFQLSINSLFSTKVIDFGIDLDVEPSIRKLDLLNPNSILYFNPVICEERVRTNFIYLLSSINSYNRERKVNNE